MSKHPDYDFMPCPRCGGDVVHLVHNPLLHPALDTTCINGCKDMGTRVTFDSDNPARFAEDRARILWNRRVEHIEAVDFLAELGL